jgi:hypothetical protein
MAHPPVVVDVVMERTQSPAAWWARPNHANPSDGAGSSNTPDSVSHTIQE